MKNNFAINDLLDAAEQKQRYAFPTSEKERRALDRRLGADEVLRPYRGCYIRASKNGELTKSDRALWLARTLSAKHPTWIFSGYVAALAYGCPVQKDTLKNPLYVLCPKVRFPSNITDRHVHRHQLTINDIHMPTCDIDDLTVAPVLRMAMDCAALYPFAESLPILDFIFKENSFEQFEIVDAAQQAGVSKIGFEVFNKYINSKSDNGGESFCRGVLLELGFKAPVLQHPFTDPQTGKEYFTDFSWRSENKELIIVEFDGMGKYFDEEKTKQRTMEEIVKNQEERTRALYRAGVGKVLRIKYTDLFNRVALYEDLLSAGVPLAREPLSGVKITKESQEVLDAIERQKGSAPSHD